MSACVTHMGKTRNAYKILVGKSERRNTLILLGRIKMDLKEIKCEVRSGFIRLSI
jgi:hypothetical protein